jgi:hypothetical protein
MGQRRNAHRQGRRPRGCAHSARVLAVERQEADLDRFVAALLALAAAPGGQGKPRMDGSHRRSICGYRRLPRQRGGASRRAIRSRPSARHVRPRRPSLMPRWSPSTSTGASRPRPPTAPN